MAEAEGGSPGGLSGASVAQEVRVPFVSHSAAKSGAAAHAELGVHALSLCRVAGNALLMRLASDRNVPVSAAKRDSLRATKSRRARSRRSIERDT